MKILFIALLFLPFTLSAQSLPCDSLSYLKTDKIEGLSLYKNKKDIILTDSINSNQKIQVSISADPRDKRLTLVFYSTESYEIRPEKDDVKILFIDGTRTSLKILGEAKYESLWVKYITSKAQQAQDKQMFTNSYGVPPPYYLDDDIIIKEIQAIRFYHSAGYFDINVKHDDALLLQKALECLFNQFN